jgi:hypothetical protein
MLEAMNERLTEEKKEKEQELFEISSVIERTRFRTRKNTMSKQFDPSSKMAFFNEFVSENRVMKSTLEEIKAHFHEFSKDLQRQQNEILDQSKEEIHSLKQLEHKMSSKISEYTAEIATLKEENIQQQNKYRRFEQRIQSTRDEESFTMHKLSLENQTLKSRIAKLE